MTFDVYRKSRTICSTRRKHSVARLSQLERCRDHRTSAKMQATGWGYRLNWRDRAGRFAYGVGINLSGVKNKALKLSGDGPVLSEDFNMDKIIRNEDGGAISRFYGFVADGIFQNWAEVKSHTDRHGNLIQPNAVNHGDIRFLDLNNNGSIDDGDKRYIGNAYPKLMAGLSLTLNWRSFDFSTNFNGTFAATTCSIPPNAATRASGGQRMGGTFDKTWHGGRNFERFATSVDQRQQPELQPCVKFLCRRRFILRCKMMQLGYTLPKSLLAIPRCASMCRHRISLPLPSIKDLIPNVRRPTAAPISTGIDWNSYRIRVLSSSAWISKF